MFQTFGEDGSLQLDCDFATYFLRLKGTAYTATRTFGNTNPSGLTITIPAGFVLPLVAVQCAAGRVGLFRSYKPGDGTTQYQYVSSAPVGSPVNYWVFDNPLVLGPAVGGLTLFDESGRVTFSSDYAPMVAVDVLTAGGVSGDFYDRAWVNTVGGSTTRPGRSLAFAQSCYGGHRIKGDLLAYGAGGPVLVDEGTSTRYTYRYNNNGKVYGASSTGDTVSFGSITFDDVQVLVGNNMTYSQALARYNETTDFMVRGVGLVVDVTYL